MTSPTIPAPERDLQTTDPQVPPASEDVSPLTRLLFGSIAVGLGIALLVIAILAAFFQASPLPQDIFNGDEVSAAVLAGVCGMCFMGCGWAIFRRSTVVTFLLFVMAVACGYFASVVA